MTVADIQLHCEQGQEHLQRMEYIQAEAELVAAEQQAWRQKDLDSLSRLYMPLQEARRQRRQRCGEGVVCLDLISTGPQDMIEPRHVVENYPQGQLLVAGWGSIETAAKVRELQGQYELYLETFLAAVYPTHEGNRMVIVPTEDVRLPSPEIRSEGELRRRLPENCIVLSPQHLPAGSRKGDTETFAQVSALWERLHGPFMAEAEEIDSSLEKIEAYRQVIRVDYACELAHQELADAARRAVRDFSRA